MGAGMTRDEIHDQALAVELEAARTEFKGDRRMSVECRKCVFYHDLMPTCGPHFPPKTNPYTGKTDPLPEGSYKNMTELNGNGTCPLFRHHKLWWLRNALGIDG